MSGDQLHNDNSTDLEAVIANDGLLDILRADAPFSVDEYGDLDIVLEKLRNGLAEFVGGFVGEEVLFELSNVAIYSDEEQFSALGTSANYVNFHDKRGGLILCVGLASNSFKRILKNLLGGKKNGDESKFSPTLTSAEHKLFERFSKRLCLAYSKTLGFKLGEYDTVETDFKLLNKLAKEVELIVLTYQVSFSDAKFMISVLTTLDQLEPESIANAKGKSGVSADANGDTWAVKLARKIDVLNVPVFAQLAEKTINLVDVAKLEKGTRLDIEFELNNVCITDSEENKLFAADLEIRESELIFRVTGPPANS